MGYALLWIENLAVSLLFVATVVAWLCRPGRRPGRPWIEHWARPAVAAIAVLLPMAVYGVVTAGLWRLSHLKLGMTAMTVTVAVPNFLFFALVALTILFAIGGVLVVLVGLRKQKDDSALAFASRWPRGKLAIALVAAVALNLMTFWNLDLGVRQRLEALQAEASALALSVAPPRVPDDQNAAFLYDQAIATMEPVAKRGAVWSEEGFQWPNDPDKKIDPTSPKLRSFLKNHASTLRLLREAAKRPACSFEWDYSRPGMDMWLRESDLLHNVEALLAVDARCKAADGDLGAAMEDINAIFALAGHFGVEPLPVMALIAIRDDKIGQETLQSVIASHRPTLMDLARIDIPVHRSYERLLRRSLRMDEAFGLSLFADLGMGSPNQLQVLVYPCEFSWPVEDLVLPLYRVFLMNDDLNGYKTVMDRQQSLAAKPFLSTKDAWDEVDREESLGRQGIVTQIVATNGAAFAKAAARGDSWLRVTRLALAACRYRAAKDKLPEKPEDVVPEYLPAVPSDPFDGKPLKWKRIDGGGLVIYSIGPDMTDDGGKPYDEQRQTGDLTFELTP